MKIRVIFPLAAVCTLLVLISLPVASVYASDPAPWPAGLPWGKGTPWPVAAPLSVGQHWSYSAPAPYAVPILPTPVPTAIPLRSVNPAPVVPAAPVVLPAPTIAPTPVPAAPQVIAHWAGSSPADALEANGAWQTLDSRASAWYVVGTAVGTGVRMEVWLDASDISGLDMSIYAPNQLDNLNGSAAGHGTTDKFAPGRLHWSGGGSSAVAGNWYARISNSGSSSVQYKVTSDQQQIAPKNCESYWEYLPSGAYVYWTACH